MQHNRGICFPFGATRYKDGINFAIHAKGVDKISLCLFHEQQPEKPYEKILLSHKNNTGSIWHIWLKGLPPIFSYAYEITLLEEPQVKHLVLDPYAKSVCSGSAWHDHARKKFKYQPLGKYYPDNFDWENDSAPNIPKKNLIIYEMHVRGLTQHTSSKVASPGTFKGMMEKIPYLVELGINAVEFLPIQEFCEEDVIHVNPKNHTKLHNFFGYSTVNFFSPMNRYASASDQDKCSIELKTLIKELHKNKIEVILDIVLNHTHEGNEAGPVVSFKGLNKNAYYLINQENKYFNFSGCGNTFNCNHPLSREFIINVLRHWVLEYHVDGFRFDLAAVFHRGKDGTPLDTTPLLEFISEDPVLETKKLIAEPWDAAGLYNLGKFASYEARWLEWNGKYQSTVRAFIKGSHNVKKSFAGAISGSHDLFGISPYSGVNYITAHDGFSLYDLVSYNEKHNLLNGEDNNDGTNNNESWNCGVEGATTSKKILRIRKQQMRNLHLALMVSQGIPMLLMGDEYAHTKHGNNNSWGQDNEINWFLWDNLNKNSDFYRYYKKLIWFRKNNPLLQFDHFLTDKEINWHGLKVNQPEWDNDNKLIAFSLHSSSGIIGLYIAFNASHLEQTFELPAPGEGKKWQWIVNTSHESPKDFYEDETKESPMENKIILIPYSAQMLKVV